MISETDLNVDY